VLLLVHNLYSKEYNSDDKRKSSVSWVTKRKRGTRVYKNIGRSLKLLLSKTRQAAITFSALRANASKCVFTSKCPSPTSFNCGKCGFLAPLSRWNAVPQSDRLSPDLIWHQRNAADDFRDYDNRVDKRRYFLGPLQHGRQRHMFFPINHRSAIWMKFTDTLGIDRQVGMLPILIHKLRRKVDLGCFSQLSARQPTSINRNASKLKCFSRTKIEFHFCPNQNARHESCRVPRRRLGVLFGIQAVDIGDEVHRQLPNAPHRLLRRRRH